VVQLRVGDRTYAVPVQALSFAGDREGPATAGGFFVEGDQLGILVDASDPDVSGKIREASEDAMRHLSLKVLN
jgi:hypothetical protein